MEEFNQEFTRRLQLQLGDLVYANIANQLRIEILERQVKALQEPSVPMPEATPAAY